MKKFDAERLLARTIAEVLALHPDLAGAASAAINEGVARGVQKIQEESNRNRLALAVALSFIGANRMTDASKQILEREIARTIGPDGCCEAERDFLARVGAAPKESL